MTLGDLYNKIESWPENTMNFRILDIFCWRGSYYDAAAEISTEPTQKQFNLDMIDEALKNIHCGWKGGEFEFDLYTPVHFESDYGTWTDGKYLQGFLIRNGQEPIVQHIFG